MHEILEIDIDNWEVMWYLRERHQLENINSVLESDKCLYKRVSGEMDRPA